MNISEIMTSNFEAIDSTTSCREAAEKMKSLNVGVLPVKEGTHLIGLITDRDIVVRCLAEGRTPDSTQAKDIASTDLVYCFEDDSVEYAAQLMEEHQIRRLMVCRHDRTPVGIVSIGDIAVKTGAEHLYAEALERISEPSLPHR